MPSLRDKLAAALAPQYTVNERVGQGGMGAVYRAYDNSLRRWVAIKVLLPQLATEVAARRFLREARTLASLNHPHIVAVHHVGESAGLFFFVMEFVDGETLAHVIARGPISRDGVVKLGRDLLDALQAVHQQGRVHCDVKPANIFITDKRTMLADFGIATSSTRGEDTITVRDFQPHTPQYATPEQVAHRPVSPQTDLYAVGIVLYESLTGRTWFDQAATYDPSLADWSGVPRALRRVLIRALHPDPAQRWSDAQGFRQHLWRTRHPPIWQPITVLTASAAAVGGLIGVFGQRAVQQRPTAESVVVVRPDYTRGSNNDRELSDSAAIYVLDRLRLNTDFKACSEDEHCARAETELLVSVARRDSSLVFETRSTDATTILAQSVDNGDAEWRAVAERMFGELLWQLSQRETPIYDDLPVNARPGDPVSVEAFMSAEKMWHEANFVQARAAYETASKFDSTCYICSWRITDIQRWFIQPPDPIHRKRVLENIGHFPPKYQLLIRARLDSPVDERLVLLEDVVESENSFFAAHFEFGDELLHRGALKGFVLERAAKELELAANQRRSLAPVWEHVLWSRLVLRDTIGAVRALHTLDSLPASNDPNTENFRISLKTALAFQIGNSDQFLSRLFQESPDLMRDQRLPVFARIMMGYGTPEGAVGVGRLLANSGLTYAGLFGQYVGLFAMGRTVDANGVVDLLSRSASEYRVDFLAFVAQLNAAMFIADSTLADITTTFAALDRFNSTTMPEDVLESIAFVQTLLTQRYDAEGATPPGVVHDARLLDLLRADALARSGDADGALAIADSLVAGEFALAVGSSHDDDRFPIFRSMLYLLRSEWYAQKGDIPAAIASLRWHENTDIYALPEHKPMTYEAGWALGTVASWKRAQLLEQFSPDVEMCRLYRKVADLWVGSDEPFRAYATAASEAWAQHDCAAP